MTMVTDIIEKLNEIAQIMNDSIENSNPDGYSKALNLSKLYKVEKYLDVKLVADSENTKAVQDSDSYIDGEIS